MQALHMYLILLIPLKSESFHDASFDVTGGTEGFLDDNAANYDKTGIVTTVGFHSPFHNLARGLAFAINVKMWVKSMSWITLLQQHFVNTLYLY